MTATPPDQRRLWEETFLEEPGLYGEAPSLAGERARDVFRAAGVERVLELGAGHGRDAIPLARSGFRVIATDYSVEGLRQARRTASREGVADRFEVAALDARADLPFREGAFDGCFSHMLFNMAFTRRELVALAREVDRVVRPGGVIVFTARSVRDPHYGKGTHHGEGLYETDGYVVHFLDHAAVEAIAGPNDIVSIEEFEEGALPRRLVLVTLRRAGGH